jgi:hypothetical protein
MSSTAVGFGNAPLKRSPVGWCSGTEDIFEHLPELHFELEHGAVLKTYGRARERFYGPVRENVEFLIARCVVRQVSPPPKTV